MATSTTSTVTKEAVKTFLKDLLIQNLLLDADLNTGLLSNYTNYIDTSGQFATGTDVTNTPVYFSSNDFNNNNTPNYNNFIEDITTCFSTDISGEYTDPLDMSSFDFDLKYEGNSQNDQQINAQNYYIKINNLPNSAVDGDSCFGHTTTYYLNTPLGTEILTLVGGTQLQQIQTTQTLLDPALAAEILDTTVYELLPQQTTNQQKVNKLFNDINALIPPNLPEFSEFNQILSETAAQYDDVSDIGKNPLGSVSDNPQTGYITRLENEATDANKGKTLESLRNRLDAYLKDLEEYVGDSDGRPEYEEKSPGYLEIRNLNQAIIIRNQEGQNIGLEEWESDGFTITQWVKFKDKVSEGTLFNYGNPVRTNGPQGFRLETLIDENQERYLRLIVRETLSGGPNGDHSDRTIDSHLPSATTNKNNGMWLEEDFTQLTNVPIDFDEWYFIVASYNPDVDDTSTKLDNTLYWTNNEAAGSPTHYSGLGNKCKVEIISKTNLLTARGYKV
jgi:hypothetical protein